MKSAKRILAMIFAVILLASIIPVSAFANDVDPTKFFSAEKNTVTFLKDNDKIVLDMWLFKGDHSDVVDYKNGLKKIKNGPDFIYSASLTKLETRDVPVRVDGAGVYTVVVRQRDGVVHSHMFELDFEHLLPSFAADAVTHIPADVQLIRYIEGDHSDMTMKELKAAGANVICHSYFTIESNGEKYYNFKKQCVGTWTFAVQYVDGNVKTVVVENEEIPEPVNLIEKYGLDFLIEAEGTAVNNTVYPNKYSLSVTVFRKDSADTQPLPEIKAYARVIGRDGEVRVDLTQLTKFYLFTEDPKLGEVMQVGRSVEVYITFTIDGESESVFYKVTVKKASYSLDD